MPSIKGLIGMAKTDSTYGEHKVNKELGESKRLNRLASSWRDSGLPWKGTQCNSTTLHAHSAGTPTVSESHRADRRKMHGSYIHSIL